MAKKTIAIPSNISTKEFVKYYAASATTEEITNQFYRLIDELEELKDKERQFDRIEEMLREQIGFAKDLLVEMQYSFNTALAETRKNSPVFNLVKSLETKIENSYFEL